MENLTAKEAIGLMQSYNEQSYRIGKIFDLIKEAAQKGDGSKGVFHEDLTEQDIYHLVHNDFSIFNACSTYIIVWCEKEKEIMSSFYTQL